MMSLQLSSRPAYSGNLGQQQSEMVTTTTFQRLWQADASCLAELTPAAIAPLAAPPLVALGEGRAAERLAAIQAMPFRTLFAVIATAAWCRTEEVQHSLELLGLVEPLAADDCETEHTVADLGLAPEPRSRRAPQIPTATALPPSMPVAEATPAEPADHQPAMEP